MVCHQQDTCPDGEYCKTWQLEEVPGGLGVDYLLMDGYCAPLAAEAGTFACLGPPTSSWCPEPFTCISGRCHVACDAGSGCPTALSCQPLGDGASACLSSQ